MVGLTIQEQEDYQKMKQNILSHDPATEEARSECLSENSLSHIVIIDKNHELIKVIRIS